MPHVRVDAHKAPKQLAIEMARCDASETSSTTSVEQQEDRPAAVKKRSIVELSGGMGACAGPGIVPTVQWDVPQFSFKRQCKKGPFIAHPGPSLPQQPASGQSSTMPHGAGRLAIALGPSNVPTTQPAKGAKDLFIPSETPDDGVGIRSANENDEGSDEGNDLGTTAASETVDEKTAALALAIADGAAALEASTSG